MLSPTDSHKLKLIFMSPRTTPLDSTVLAGRQGQWIFFLEK